MQKMAWKTASMILSFFLPYLLFFLSQGAWKNEGDIYRKAGYTFAFILFLVFLYIVYTLLKKLMPMLALKLNCREQFIQMVEGPMGTLILLSLYLMMLSVFVFTVVLHSTSSYAKWRSGVYQANIIREKLECKELQRSKDELERSLKIAVSEIKDPAVIAYTEKLHNHLKLIHCLSF